MERRDAWYSIVSVESILNRAPLHKPFFWGRAGEGKEAAWNPEATPLEKRGWFLYNPDIAFDLFCHRGDGIIV